MSVSLSILQGVTDECSWGQGRWPGCGSDWWVTGADPRRDVTHDSAFTGLRGSPGCLCIFMQLPWVTGGQQRRWGENEGWTQLRTLQHFTAGANYSLHPHLHLLTLQTHLFIHQIRLHHKHSIPLHYFILLLYSSNF